MGNRNVETEQAYDSIAGEYAMVAAGRSFEADEFFASFADRLRPGAMVADLGCGPGDDLVRLEGRGARGIGLDRSVELLKLAAGRPRVRADLSVLPFRSGSLGGVWSHASLLHVEGRDLGVTFAEWDRVLASGGVVGMTTSLGGDSGWESVPATGPRVPALPAGRRRWFVHHDQEQIVDVAVARGWAILHRSVRSSHREWVQLVAAKSD